VLLSSLVCLVFLPYPSGPSAPYWNVLPWRVMLSIHDLRVAVMLKLYVAAPITMTSAAMTSATHAVLASRLVFCSADKVSSGVKIAPIHSSLMWGSGLAPTSVPHS